MAKSFVKGKTVDPWKNCLNFRDAVLDAFIHGFGSHPDHATAVAEFDRRRQQRERVAAAADEQAKVSVITRLTGWAEPIRWRPLKHKRLAG